MSWNFALILFVLLVLTGVVWMMDVAWLRPARQRRVADAAAEFDRDRAPHLARVEGQAAVSQHRERTLAEAGKAPWWVEYSVSFFPVILFVFVLRSFVVEPFRIPSGSMLPTLQSGDLILVNKFTYGIRLPVVDTKVIGIGEPQRGDIMVFRYPPEPDVDFIKRVVGLPGDEIAYVNKELSVNGKPVPRERMGDYFEPDRASYSAEFSEQLGDVSHRILLDAQPGGSEIYPNVAFPYHNRCSYQPGGMRCTVPEGHYFVMGDNRDNSADSRYWGFVPDKNVVGKAFFIWMNFSDLSRIGGVR
ncbi:signal peptidase I [Verticiella sediminum]|uniref:Signal peptidase I n=1 Tax=Verticiella sediminum TaxID=1247510 RepID=A0A556AS27_9BURK|nr:signal peptidase I [Verticiella sediminum]TSH95737.1 signal peptidase I [Verticiella sediminum]